VTPISNPSSASPTPPDRPVHDRYLRQRLLPQLGDAGQERLAASHALIVGCGALGCAVADSLARAGVGRLTVVDRDVVERSNLHRQMLFTENHAEVGAPKAVAARERLRAVNRDVEIDAVVADFNASNARDVGAEAQLIIDGLDNFETRYLLNDLAVATRRPFIHAGVVGTSATALTILPPPNDEGAARPIPWSVEHVTPCMRCLFPDLPAPGAMDTCETAGVLGPAVSFIAAHEAMQAIKLLAGDVDALDRALWSVDVWTNALRRLDVYGARDPDCPCCARRRFDFLDGRTAGLSSVLCGQNAVQIVPANPPLSTDPLDRLIDLNALAGRLQPHGSFTVTPFLLRGRLDREAPGAAQPAESGEAGDAALELTVFPDGRAIIKGTDDLARARTLYARYVGQ
jgi:adenylyltransferase/sulfurtransferase